MWDVNELPRIAHIITGLDVGGAENMLLNMLTMYDFDRYTPVVIALSGKGELYESFVQLGIEVRCFDFKRKIPFMEFFRMMRFLKRSKIDILQTWLYHGDFIGGIAGKLLYIPVVWGIHNSYLDANGKRSTSCIRKLNARLSYGIPAKIVSCSSFAAELHKRIGYADKMTVIPNGFDIKRFAPSAEKRENFRRHYGLGESLVLGVVARHDPLKDFGNFFAALGRVLKNNPDVKAVMCGREITRDNAEIAAQINRYHLEENIYLLGEQRNISEVMNGIDYLVLSSKSEAFPMVLGEAMACGKPCISTDVGDARYIVGDTGICVPKEKPDLLANGIVEAISWDRAKYKRQALLARERILANFTVNSMLEKYFKLYDEILNR